MEKSDLKFSSLILAAVLIVLSSLPCRAQISPGELSVYHAGWEGIANCTRCHELGKEPAAEKCLQCHSALKNRIDSNRGFHSSDSVKSVKCFRCHSEHNGREFVLIYWQKGREFFDHGLTGYDLEGKHVKVPCEKCHTRDFITDQTILNAENIDPDRTYLGLNQACTSCHTDEHRKQLANDCLNCHVYTGWKPASGFNHDSTGYQLTGKHRDASCEKCHHFEWSSPQETSLIGRTADKTGYSVYEDLQFANCTPCHQDVHAGKLGNDCNKCHNTDGFGKSSESSFNHDLTDYPLKGMHSDAACLKCHVSGKMTAALQYEKCTDCHKDEHRGQFSDSSVRGSCESCHSVDGFLPAKFGIAEHLKSDYKLSGSHLAVPCNLCHYRMRDAEGIDYTVFDLEYHDCRDCHRDVHRGEAAKWMPENSCESCHSTASWDTITFEHQGTGFMLDGHHFLTECRDCHLISDNIRLSGIPSRCGGCHSDIHNGQFVESDTISVVNCGKCHISDGWKLLQFDHDTDSRFPLTGVHHKVDCVKCHQELADENNNSYILYKPLSIECVDCHGDTDILKPKP